MTFVIARRIGNRTRCEHLWRRNGKQAHSQPPRQPPPLSPAGILRLANKGLSGNFEATYKLSGDLGVFPGPGMDRARRPPRTLGTKERLDARQRRMVLSA